MKNQTTRTDRQYGYYPNQVVLAFQKKDFAPLSFLILFEIINGYCVNIFRHIKNKCKNDLTCIRKLSHKIL